jgi:hypothetical protein
MLHPRQLMKLHTKAAGEGASTPRHARTTRLARTRKKNAMHAKKRGRWKKKGPWSTQAGPKHVIDWHHATHTYYKIGLKKGKGKAHRHAHDSARDVWGVDRFVRSGQTSCARRTALSTRPHQTSLHHAKSAHPPPNSIAQDATRPFTGARGRSRPACGAWPRRPWRPKFGAFHLQCGRPFGRPHQRCA